MSGHSHWATIKRRKGIQDQKRGKIFSKLAKAISLAACHGTDPEKNFKLRLLMEKAKQVNMPKENISRAIEKGSGQGETSKLEEIIYEGYGPQGVAVIAEAVTDNRNRATAEIKNIFERGGGSLASPGAVSFQFKNAGLIVVKKEKKVDDQILKLMDFKVDDVEEAEDGIEVYTSPAQLNEIKNEILKAGFEVVAAELTKKPQALIKLAAEGQQAKVVKLLESLEEHEDIQKVYANLA